MQNHKLKHKSQKGTKEDCGAYEKNTLRNTDGQACCPTKSASCRFGALLLQWLVSAFILLPCVFLIYLHCVSSMFQIQFYFIFILVKRQSSLLWKYPVSNHNKWLNHFNSSTNKKYAAHLRNKSLHLCLEAFFLSLSVCLHHYHLLVPSLSFRLSSSVCIVF